MEKTATASPNPHLPSRAAQYVRMSTEHQQYSPPANVIDEQSRKVRLLVFHVRHQSVETLPTSDVQAAPAVIRVRLNDFHTVRGGVLKDHFQLVFGTLPGCGRERLLRIRPQKGWHPRPLLRRAI
jgi:hypothetical protein